ATSSSRPVVVPCPTSTRPVLTSTVLSAWIASNESTAPRSNGPPEANGSTPARARPAAESATISAPPPFTNARRESVVVVRGDIRDARGWLHRRTYEQSPHVLKS